MMLQNAQAEFIDSLLGDTEPGNLLSPAKQMQIYRQHVNASLLKTMQLTYPAIHALLGKEFFDMATREYLRQYPSRSGNLDDYGEYFSDFLANYQPVHDLTYLTEVAAFEWAMHTVYLAADHPPFAAHTLASFAPEQHGQLRFTLHPASWLRKFHYPVLQMIELCNQHREEDIDLRQGGVNVLLVRKEQDVAIIKLSADDFAFLHALSRQMTLSEALQAAEAIDANYLLDEKLPYFIQEHIIVDCYLSEA